MIIRRYFYEIFINHHAPKVHLITKVKEKGNNVATSPFRALHAQATNGACTRQGPALRPIITLSLNVPHGIPSGASTAAVPLVYAPCRRDINITRDACTRLLIRSSKRSRIIFTLLLARKNRYRGNAWNLYISCHSFRRLRWDTKARRRLIIIKMQYIKY